MKVGLVIGLLFVFSCHSQSPKGFFKYYDGYYIGDELTIPSSTSQISNDTLFKLNDPVAKYLNLRYSVNGNVFLQIESLDTQQKGVYIKK